MALWNIFSRSENVEFNSFNEASFAAFAKIEQKKVQIFPPGNKEGEKWASYRMLSKVSEAHRASILSKLGSDVKLDRSIGCMVGMAVADAVGAPLEFLPVCNGDNNIENSSNYHLRSKFTLNNMEYIGTSNKFQLKPGQWTDDASMGFCIADSLLANGGAYDGSDIRTRFHLWWNFGYANAFINDPSRSGSVGLGGNIAMSLDSCRAGEVPTPVFERKNEDAGIGSLMRLAPIPVRYHSNIEVARARAAQSSLTTHPGLLGAECCAFVSHLIVSAINRESAEDEDIKVFIDRMVGDYICLLESRISEEKQDNGHATEDPTETACAADSQPMRKSPHLLL